MNLTRAWMPLLLGGLVAIGVFFLLRGAREPSDVPDTAPTVGAVTSDPDPRPLSGRDPDDLLTAGSSGPARDPASSGDIASPPAPVVTGTVSDLDGRAIEGAALVLRTVDPQSLRGAWFPDGEIVAEGTSDRDGAFRLDLPPGAVHHRLFAAADGYARASQLVSGPGLSFDIVLSPAGTLRVQVVDHEGEPVPTAEIRILGSAVQIESETDDQGHAQIVDLPPGAVSVQARAGARRIVGGPVQITPGQVAELLLGLEAGVPVGARVVSAEDGTPIAGASVHVAQAGRSIDLGLTDKDGRVPAQLAGSLGERVFLSVHADGRAPVLQGLVLAEGLGDEALEPEVRLSRAPSWRGTVQDAVGQPVAGAVVRYSADGVAGRTPASTTSDERGLFELPPPPPPAPGRRVVLIAESEGRTAAMALRPHQPLPRPLTLRLVRGSTVTGRLRNEDGDGVAGWRVRLIPRWRELPRTPLPGPAASLFHARNEEGFPGLTTGTDGQGRFVFPGIPEGPWTLRWARGDVIQARQLDVDVSGGRTDVGTLTVSTGARVEGEVRTRSGESASGAVVRLALASPARTLTRTADALGSFQFEDVPPGTHRLLVSVPGAAEVREVIDVTEEDLRHDVVLEMGSPISLSVREGERPYDGLLSLRLLAEGRSAGPIRRLRVRQGEAEVRHLAPGAWRFVATTPTGLVARSEDFVDVTESRVEHVVLRLEAGLTLQGRITTIEANPVAGAHLLLTSPDDPEFRRHATSDRSGGYRISGLAEGDYELHARGRGGAPVRQPVRLRSRAGDGTEIQLDVQLEPAGSLRIRVVDGGRGVPNALLLFRTEAGALRTETPDRTSAEGTLLRHDLPLGEIEVLARSAGGRLGRGYAIINAEGVAEVTIELEDEVR